LIRNRNKLTQAEAERERAARAEQAARQKAIADERAARQREIQQKGSKCHPFVGKTRKKTHTLKNTHRNCCATAIEAEKRAAQKPAVPTLVVGDETAARKADAIGVSPPRSRARAATANTRPQPPNNNNNNNNNSGVGSGASKHTTSAESFAPLQRTLSGGRAAPPPPAHRPPSLPKRADSIKHVTSNNSNNDDTVASTVNDKTVEVKSLSQCVAKKT
jgi:hypothetical protein